MTFDGYSQLYSHPDRLGESLLLFIHNRNTYVVSDMSSISRSPEPVWETPSLATLPPELLVEISEHLAATFSLKSLASLNAVSHQLHDTTLSVLYRKLILVTRDPEGFEERDTSLTIEEGMSICQGWKHTKCSTWDSTIIFL
jgi:hypothetical protein